MSSAPWTDKPRAVLPLPSHLVDQIAAGEVVDRPSAVVKELVENALDAGANNVAIDLDEGGLTSIVVTDDGHGMDEVNLRRSILRHATSKLRSLDDLERIATYGFRGEALSSIASVSRLTITTRANTADVGIRLQVDGGHHVRIEKAGCPVGTSVAICDLFYNTPARRKFLRAAATEQAHAHEALLRLALGRRAGGFVMTSHARTLLDVPGTCSRHDRPQLAFGRRQKGFVPFEGTPGPVTVSGFLAPPRTSRRDASCVWLFVNGRPVRDRSLQRAAVSGYQTAFPDAMGTMLVFIDVLADTLDVNVHPQKWEVRFGDAHAVYASVERSVALAAAAQQAGATRALWRPSALRVERATSVSPMSGETSPLKTGAPARTAAFRPVPATQQALRARTFSTQDDRDAAAPQLPFAAAPAQQEPWQLLRPLAHAPSGTLCCLGPAQSLVLVDIAKVRIAIARARLQAHLRQGVACLPSAPVLLPPTFVPTAQEEAFVTRLAASESVRDARRLGLTLERCGPDSVVVCRAPTLWAEASTLAVARALATTALPEAPLDTWEEQATLSLLQRIHDAIAGQHAWPEHAEPTGGIAWAAPLLETLAQLKVPYGPRLALHWQR